MVRIVADSGSALGENLNHCTISSKLVKKQLLSICLNQLIWKDT
nr:MAG TPA: hypothetical protein [Caudoviricetes sp.]